MVVALVGSCVIREANGLARFLKLRPLAYIGAVSYGVYLLNTLVMDVNPILNRLGIHHPLLKFPILVGSDSADRRTQLPIFRDSIPTAERAILQTSRKSHQSQRWQWCPHPLTRNLLHTPECAGLHPNNVAPVQSPVLLYSGGKLAGAEGFEPSPSSLTVRCPTSWTTPQRR